MKLPGTLVLVLGLGWSALAQAQIFTCRNASGQLITSDRPLPECGDRPVRELTPNGRVVREIPAPLTPQQRAERAAQEERERRLQEQQAEERRLDRLLLSRYDSVEAIEAARKRSLEVSEEGAKSARDRMTLLDRERKVAQAELDALQATGKPIPMPLRRKLEALAEQIRQEASQIGYQEEEIKRINARFDTERARYLELIRGTARR